MSFCQFFIHGASFENGMYDYNCYIRPIVPLSLVGIEPDIIVKKWKHYAIASCTLASATLVVAANSIDSNFVSHTIRIAALAICIFSFIRTYAVYIQMSHWPKMVVAVPIKAPDSLSTIPEDVLIKWQKNQIKECDAYFASLNMSEKKTEKDLKGFFNFCAGEEYNPMLRFEPSMPPPDELKSAFDRFTHLSEQSSNYWEKSSLALSDNEKCKAKTKENANHVITKAHDTRLKVKEKFSKLMASPEVKASYVIIAEYVDQYINSFYKDYTSEAIHLVYKSTWNLIKEDNENYEAYLFKQVEEFVEAYKNKDFSHLKPLIPYSPYPVKEMDIPIISWLSLPYKEELLITQKGFQIYLGILNS